MWQTLSQFLELNSTTRLSHPQTLQRKTLAYQKSRRVAAERLASMRIWYPTVSPIASPRSAATRCATDVALMRLHSPAATIANYATQVALWFVGGVSAQRLCMLSNDGARHVTATDTTLI